MIPLKTSVPINSLPRYTVIGLFVFFACSMIAKSDLSSWALNWNSPSWQMLMSVFVFPSFWALFTGLIFFWVFSPRVFLNRSLPTILMIAFSGLFLSAWSFSQFQFNEGIPFFLSDGLIGIFLGLFMRRDIWGNVNSLVFGIGWARVYEVPSYVLLFFWFFYQLIGQFFLVEPFSELRMIYWIPFFTFCWGFLAETFLIGIENFLRAKSRIQKGFN
jgi:hypothetical protein